MNLPTYILICGVIALPHLHHDCRFLLSRDDPLGFSLVDLCGVSARHAWISTFTVREGGGEEERKRWRKGEETKKVSVEPTYFSKISDSKFLQQLKLISGKVHRNH